MAGDFEVLRTDILILGSGGAGLLAALHSHDACDDLDITIVVKGMFGKSGCTRMVQGGYNVVLNPEDSFEKHFLDTVKGGGFLNDQELVWTMVCYAPRCILELETKYGCFFDRNPDGTIHQKPFAGQTFDRTVHKGDLTGIEIINRLSEQVVRRKIRILEEHRALELVLDASGKTVAGAVVLDIQSGRFLVVQAKAVLVATGGGPTMYKITAASADKSMDGIAMALRVGAELCDMEMVQFHPTGLIAASSLITGTVLEEGLRGAGGHLYNALGERFMKKYDPVRMERSTRDIVSRSSYLEIMEGRGSSHGGIFIDMRPLGAEFVEQHFPGMVKRCRDLGFDLARQPVEVSPTAHFHMGGVKITADCQSNIPGLFVAGEDAGGVQGANRLGGNGVTESTVFGALAGDAMAAYVKERGHVEVNSSQAAEIIHRTQESLGQGKGGDVYNLKREMQDLMWEKAGLVRDGKNLEAAITRLEELREKAEGISAPGDPVYNRTWHDLLNLRNHLLVCEMIAHSALFRQESRGSHFRSDFPRSDDRYIKNVFVRRNENVMELYWKAANLSRVRPGETEIWENRETQRSATPRD